MYKKLPLIFLVFAFVKSEDIYEKCGDKLQCVEKEMVKYVDRLDATSSLPILGDFLVLDKIAGGRAADAPRSDEGIFERCTRYLATHELKIKPLGASERSLVEEGRTKRLRRILLPILILLKLKAVIVIPIVLSVIALVAFKGLGASLVALALAGATGFKSLLENHHGNSKLTYEVVPQIGSPHWSRAGVDPTQHQGYHTIP